MARLHLSQRDMQKIHMVRLVVDQRVLGFGGGRFDIELGGNAGHSVRKDARVVGLGHSPANLRGSPHFPVLLKLAIDEL